MPPLPDQPAESLLAVPPTSPLLAPEPAEPPAPSSPLPKPPQLRDIGDAAETRRRIYDQVRQAAAELPPVENTSHRLLLTDVDYDGPETYSLADQKRAILSGDTLSRRLRGTWVLQDLAGQELGRRQATLARVPVLTDRGTFISRGSEQSLAHQLRLRPGVYTRQQANGEHEAHVNVSRGLGHHIYLDPATGIFRIKLGQARIPLTSLLRAQGVTERELKEAWGPELARVNLAKADPQGISKLYQKLYRQGDAPPAEQPAAVAKAFAEMVLDPEVTKRTLGEALDRVTPGAVLAITKKLLRVSRGEADVDDRDAMEYQTLVGPEDLFAERIRKSRGLVRRLLWKVSPSQDINKIPANALDEPLRTATLTSGLGLNPEEVNPAELLDQASRVTRMGEGGIRSVDSIPDESRGVQPSQLGFVDYLRTAESSRVGVDLRLASAARKGDDGRVYAPVRNLKTGQVEYKSPQDLADSVVAFPGELDRPGRTVTTLRRGKLGDARREDVEYVMERPEDAFSRLGNLIPLKSAVKGQRAVMASRMLTQALPLQEPEAPLVQSAMPDTPDRSFEDEYGRFLGALRAEQPGQVLAVGRDGIKVRYADGKKATLELYDAFPFNRKTGVTQTPTVQVGQQFDAGQLLARSNYTDANGTAALGKNVRVAYVPWAGLAFEDAVVVSESLAKRLTSEHQYQHSHEWTDKSHKGKSAYVSLFPSTFNRKTLETLDDDGLVKPGTVVKYGDPLILAAADRELNRKSLLKGRMAKDQSVLWEHEAPGIVTDAVLTRKGATVAVQSLMPTQVGDKVAGRYGDKGVISAIIPDDRMPVGEDGRPFELLLNPLGTISRVNPAQLLEAALGKIAERRGQPIKIRDFADNDDLAATVVRMLQEHGLSDKETLTDPETGRRIPQIATGNRWLMKLHHTAEGKSQGRGLGSYTAEHAPAKGGYAGAKRIGMLETTSLLSHGAASVLRNAKLVRGQANPEYWAQYQAGFNPATPRVPFVYTQFVNQLRAAGINPVRENSRIHLMALTDTQVDELAGDRELQNAETVDWQNMEPIKGGLFDPQLTGGHAGLSGGGNRWAKITLHEPLPSPVMEEPIRRLLGLTRPRFEDILAGREKLQGMTGSAAIAKALDRIDVERELATARADIASGRKTKRDAAVRRLTYLKSAQRLGMHPRQWMLSKVPVLPPAFRPVSVMGGQKLPLVADANYLYRELWETNRTMRDLSEHVSADDLGDERLSLYKSLQAVTGLGEPTQPKNQERKVKGVLKQLIGSSPKTGVVQRKLLASTVDFVGRATIIPDPDLDMDEVGLPESSAWDIYRPLVTRHLVRKGMSRRDAVRAVVEKQPVARKALLSELETGVVLVNRAPTLHRYGIMAMRPKLTSGDVLRIPPLVVSGFGADFDGDAMQFHALPTAEEREEALEKMLPSRNLLAVKSFGPQHLPSQEYVAGLYEASTRKSDGPMEVFDSVASVLRSLRAGKLDLGRRVMIPDPPNTQDRR